MCQHCEKAYTQKIDLKRHQIKHHDSSENEKEKYLFTCESCGKNLTRKTRLNAHGLMAIIQDMRKIRKCTGFRV